MSVIPAAAFKQHKDNLTGLEVPADAPKFWLNKLWLEFHTALRGMPKPLCLAISGDHPVYGRLDGGLLRAGDDTPDDEVEEMDDEDGDDGYFGVASPALVKRLDAALGQFSDAELLAAIKSAGWPRKKGASRHYGSSFDQLRKAYRAAAETGAAVMVVIT
jgi:hypothetical protein